MRATGVVRRIDDLGRIVIPKEIRKTLRIRDGESLEFFVDNEMISLKKYSSMNDLVDISDNLVSIIFHALNKNTIICDCDSVISVSSNIKNKYKNKHISKYVNSILKERINVVKSVKENVELIEGEIDNYSYTVVPILSNGDVIGGIILFSDNKEIDDVDIKVAVIAAQFIGKHIEE